MVYSYFIGKFYMTLENIWFIFNNLLYMKKLKLEKY